VRLRIAFFCWLLPGVLLAGCGLFSGPGLTAGDVAKQAQKNGDILFDVVKVDDRVLATVLKQPPPPFASRFAPIAAPKLRIAVGDDVAVVIWEAAVGGLFTQAPPESGLGTEPLTTTPQPPAEQNPLLPNPAPEPGLTSSDVAQFAEEEARQGVQIPAQIVAFDGAISVPFAGRVRAAGLTPQQVADNIEERLADKALMPQILVLVLGSEANAVSVAGEVGQAGRIPLTEAGSRLLQVIAAAGGAQGPVQDIVVRLSRGGVTAAIPLSRLVADPAEDIYAQPGDVLTLYRIPKTFAVFGASRINRLLAFDAPHVALAEALARVHGLDDDRANPKGVYVFRYEPLEVVRALQMPPATKAVGESPIVYRFDFMDPKAYLLASRFPLEDKDVIFVADADGRRLYQFVDAFNNVVGPIETGLVTCYSAKC
jgi:polysaccharide biosynthesis/export protein